VFAAEENDMTAELRLEDDDATSSGGSTDVAKERLVSL
jgi:hypothetical protein